MENAPVTIGTSKTTPKDFFLWTGLVISLYGSVIAFISLLFEYINRTFPDPLAGYADPYGGSVRFAMASLIVLVPTALILLRVVLRTILDEPAKANIWIRRWALFLTIFIAGSTVVIDLITLINTFLGGEITTRFLLKVTVILLVAGGFTLHFLADLRGYWIEYPKKAQAIGLAGGVLALLTVIAGFFIIGTPQEARMLRYDEQRLGDLQMLQGEILTYWQQKEDLPQTLNELQNPLSGYSVSTVDPETGVPYRYEAIGDLSFNLCATFSLPSIHTKGQGTYPSMGRDIAVSYPGMGENQNWQHEAGETCFERTIDPELYPPYPKPL